MTLIGAWHRGSRADRQILATLAGCEYERVERSVADLLRKDDCPVWCVDQYRGVVSRIDALFAISPWITETDIVEFMQLAEVVLSESDPALELPETRQWAAGLYGKVREHSDALRTGVCETLVLLSVHGNPLFQNRLGIDMTACVAGLVRRLLTPLTSGKLRSHDRNLPGYAEAAPREFLALLEEDLRRDKPVLRELLKPASSGMFGHPWRTGVLWALERLAWSPQTLMRVVTVLARLSQTRIEDNWVNKPINSLAAIFRSWIPQTAASLGDRVKALNALCERFPVVGWEICIQQFTGGPQTAQPSARPKWRNDAAEAGQPVPDRERSEFARAALDLAISWPDHTEVTLGDLVERLRDLPDSDKHRVWQAIRNWSEAGPDVQARARLRERIRVVVLTRPRRFGGLEDDQRDIAREMYDRLAPRDAAWRHKWLFAKAWLAGLELDDRHLDLREREARIDHLRRNALAEIWSAQGIEGIRELLTDCDAWTLGRYTALCAPDWAMEMDGLLTTLSNSVASRERADNFMRGFLGALGEDTRATLINRIVGSAPEEHGVRLFLCLPFRSHTWRLLDQQEQAVRDQYWSTVIPEPALLDESETIEVIDQLLNACRPRAAFSAVRFDWSKLETSRLKRLLMAITKTGSEPSDFFPIDPFDVSRALDSLDERPTVTVDEMAHLEFAFVHMLDDSEHGIPNLQRKIAESPVEFVRVLALFCKRSDGGQDPSELKIDDPHQRDMLAQAAYHLLRQTKRLPGTNDRGGVDVGVLGQWVSEARRLCVRYGRAVIGDLQIGELLSNAPADADGLWPCRPVCEVLEAIASKDVARGFAIGVSNARGVHVRGLDEGGQQERELSAKYRSLAERVAFDYPHVASILGHIAESYDREATWEDSEVLVRKRLED